MYIFQPDRYLLKQQIKRYSHYIKGKVLDVGAGEFSRYRNLFKCEEYIKMDIKKSENIDVIGNAENIPFKDETFDAIVCTQVLGDINNIYKAVQEFYRVLKPKGIVLLTESLMNEMHDEPHDYWRFTKFGLKHLFKKAGFKIIAIDQRGSFFSIKAQNNIRYLIDRFNLYSHRWAKILNPIFRIYSQLMFFLDKIDKSKANRKFAIGWCIIVQK